MNRSDDPVANIALASVDAHSGRKRNKKGLFGLVNVCLLLSACATADHGTFVPNTYRGNYSEEGRRPLGPVRARSCQTRVLYVFPSGPGASTQEALSRAMGQYDGTD